MSRIDHICLRSIYYNVNSSADKGKRHLENIYCTVWVIILFIFRLANCLYLLQVSAIELDIIEIDPDTKEMLKSMVSSGTWAICYAFLQYRLFYTLEAKLEGGGTVLTKWSFIWASLFWSFFSSHFRSSRLQKVSQKCCTCTFYGGYVLESAWYWCWTDVQLSRSDRKRKKQWRHDLRKKMQQISGHPGTQIIMSSEKFLNSEN